MNQVIPLYMDQASLFRYKARVTKIGLCEVNKKNFQFVHLDQTIFHPKGGGQLSDEGTIDGIKVLYVHKELFDKDRVDQFEIKHCFDTETKLPFKEGDLVELVIDEEKRKLYARMHTAGHLLADATTAVFPGLKAYQGNHDPENGFVRFRMDGQVYEKQEIMQKVTQKLKEFLETDLPVDVVKEASGMRAIQIGKSIMPCGGVHVTHLNEIGRIELLDASINRKEQTITIKYKVY